MERTVIITIAGIAPKKTYSKKNKNPVIRDTTAWNKHSPRKFAIKMIVFIFISVFKFDFYDRLLNDKVKLMGLTLFG